MHIAILSTSYPLKPGASSGIFVSRLVDALPGNLDKTIITPCPDFPVQPEMHSGVTVTCFRYAPRRWQRLAHGPGGIPVALRRQRWLVLLLPVLLISMLLSCIRIARRTDLIHANWSLNGLVAGIAGKLTATPVITTLRGSDVSRLEHSLLRRILLYGCLRTNCRVVAVNNAIKDAVCGLYPRYSTRMVTVANGVDDSFLGIAAGEDRQHGATRITSIGNLNPNKRMHTIIEALPLIKGKPQISLCIVGDGPERDRLQSLAATTANDHTSIDLTGSKDPDEIPSILAETDIFILASRAEGRPNVILEAMAAGRPILASDIEGIRELITHEETGLLFRVDDPGSLAVQLERLLSDPELCARLGQAARRFITTHQLTWERCAGSYLELYQACLQDVTAG
jgi:glycosyltransferase involved in cell wall biosynthesis